VGRVVGVWFGFALRCVALLCGVFVRLHLALFPAGGPVLPSLYVILYSHIGLLCGVFVRLHLALFPAGRPFLPPLYVNLYSHRSIFSCGCVLCGLHLFMFGLCPSSLSVTLYSHRETEEKARQPETKLGAIAQTSHIARLFLLFRFAIIDRFAIIPSCSITRGKTA
jgi:hypothetical protein